MFWEGLQRDLYSAKGLSYLLSLILAALLREMLVALNDLAVRGVDRVDQLNSLLNALPISVEICLAQVEQHEIVEPVEVLRYRAALLEIEGVHQFSYDSLRLAQVSTKLSDVFFLQTGEGMVKEFYRSFIHHKEESTAVCRGYLDCLVGRMRVLSVHSYLFVDR